MLGALSVGVDRGSDGTDLRVASSPASTPKRLAELRIGGASACAPRSFGRTAILEKLQVFFAKERRLCFLSHHDLMRTFHRALRRARLPVSLTKGYNPRPRVVFPHALEVGIPSASEAVEIELDQWVQPAEFARRLSEALPEGLTVGEVRLIAPRRKGSRAVEAVYAAELGAGDLEAARDGLNRFLERDEWKIERTRPDGRRREVDLRRQVIEILLTQRERHGGPRLVMRLRLGCPGAARPREVLAAVLGCQAEEALGVPLKKTKTVLTAPA